MHLTATTRTLSSAAPLWVPAGSVLEDLIVVDPEAAMNCQHYVFQPMFRPL
jgi:hypothetical protein